MRFSRPLAVVNALLLVLALVALFICSTFYQFSLLDLALFLVYACAFVVVPGGLALSALSLPGLSSKSRFVLANALGLSGLCYFSWLLDAKFKLPYYSGIYLISGLSFFYLLFSFVTRRAKIAEALSLQNRIPGLFQSSEFTVLLLVALLSMFAANGLARNAILQDGSLCFYGTAGLDGIWHMGNVAYMKRDFDFADIHQNEFKYAYHFFIYVFAALACNIFDLSTASVLFKFLPIYSVFFLLYSCYVSGSAIFGSRRIGIAAAILVLFMDDAVISIKLGQILNSGWLEYLYLGPKITSAFLNSPSYTAALVTFFPLLLLFKNRCSRVKVDRTYISIVIAAGFMIGTIAGFKASTFLVLGLGLMVLAAIEIFRHRSAFFTSIGVMALLVSLPFLIELQGSPNEKFRFNPAYFPFESALGRDLLALSSTPAYLYGIALAIVIIYIVVELGPKLLSIRFIVADWRRPVDGVNLIWICAIIGVGLTLLITPSSDAYNAMYFHRFGCVCLAFLTGRTLVFLFRQKGWSAILFSGLCLFYAAGGLYTFFRLRSEASLRVPQDKIAGLQTLVNPHDAEFKTIIGNRYSYEEEFSQENIFYLYSAFSENTILSEGERYSVIRFADSLALQRVRDDIAVFYTTDDRDTAREILEKWSVDYVLVDLEYGQRLHFAPTFLKQVYTSENLIIYAFRRDLESSWLNSL